MKRIWIFLYLLCSAAVFLMACSDNQAAEAVVPTELPNTVAANPTATLPITTNNLSQIGQTGQPQLLNAYASW
jgi:hypothetical protein